MEQRDLGNRLTSEQHSHWVYTAADVCVCVCVCVYVCGWVGGGEGGYKQVSIILNNMLLVLPLWYYSYFLCHFSHRTCQMVADTESQIYNHSIYQVQYTQMYTYNVIHVTLATHIHTYVKKTLKLTALQMCVPPQKHFDI